MILSEPELPRAKINAFAKLSIILGAAAYLNILRTTDIERQ